MTSRLTGADLPVEIWRKVVRDVVSEYGHNRIDHNSIIALVQTHPFFLPFAVEKLLEDSELIERLVLQPGKVFLRYWQNGEILIPVFKAFGDMVMKKSPDVMLRINTAHLRESIVEELVPGLILPQPKSEQDTADQASVDSGAIRKQESTFKLLQTVTYQPRSENVPSLILHFHKISPGDENQSPLLRKPPTNLTISDFRTLRSLLMSPSPDVRFRCAFNGVWIQMFRNPERQAKDGEVTYLYS